MKKFARLLMTWLALALLAAPVSLLLAWLLHPFWSWVEVNAGVESIGHSGPASWCYGVVYAVVLLVLWVASTRMRIRRS